MSLTRAITGRGKFQTLTVAVVGGVLLGGSVPSAAAADEVPVLGQVRFVADEKGNEVVVSLHAVRRVEGGTAIYYSFGEPSTNKEGVYPQGIDSNPRAFFKGKQPGVSRRNALISMANKAMYTGLAEGGKGDCICTDFINRIPGGPGKAYVQYQVVAPLPDGTDIVDVRAGGSYFSGITVEDGALEPAVDPTQPILVGTGWPEIDPAEIAADTSPQTSVLDLTATVTDEQKTIVRRDTKDTIAVSLAADVLFAVDQATLSPKAQTVLQQAAAEIKAAGASGALQVTGHTDSNGSDATNLDLSKRRAAAVDAALKPLLGAGVTSTVSGKGETEPVASNETNDGRQLNRRVTVSFTPKGGQG